MSNLESQKSRNGFQRPHSQTSQRSVNSSFSRVSKKELSAHRQSVLMILKNLKDPKALLELFDKYQSQNKDIDLVEMKANGKAKIKKYKDCIYFGEIVNSKRHGKGILKKEY